MGPPLASSGSEATRQIAHVSGLFALEGPVCGPSHRRLRARIWPADATHGIVCTVTNPDRLSALDAAFLDLERGGAHMHVASIMVFAGEPPVLSGLGKRAGMNANAACYFRGPLLHDD